MWRSDNWLGYALDRPMATSPGTAFHYNTASPYLLSGILTKATGERAADYARERLFGPLGISDVFWGEDPEGISDGDALFLQPRDMAKLGYLYLRNGVWDGAQITPPMWNEPILHASLPTGVDGLRYANLFWLDLKTGAFFAAGYHGQYIFVMPAQDIVAVATAAGVGTPPSDVEIALIAKAVKSDEPLPPDPAAQAMLAKRVREAATERPLPISERSALAKTISGKVYRFSDNPLRLQSLTLRLDGPDPSYAYVLKPVRPGAPAKSFQGPIGLEGLCRTGLPRPEGTVPAARGRWSDDRTFVLQFEDLGRSG
jgi:CubicO group peptidase (beta-lactamase class C family)